MGQGASRDIKMSNRLVGEQCANNWIDMVRVDDGAHDVDLVKFVGFHLNQLGKRLGQPEPHIVVGNCDATDGRVGEHGEHKASCDTIIDLIVVELDLDKVKHVRDDHDDCLHGLLI